MLIAQTRSLSAASVSVLTEQSPLSMSKISGLCVAVSVLDGLADMTNTITSLSTVNANTALFEENIDFLTDMKNNGLRPYARDAASRIIDSCI